MLWPWQTNLNQRSWILDECHQNYFDSLSTEIGNSFFEWHHTDNIFTDVYNYSLWRSLKLAKIFSFLCSNLGSNSHANILVNVITEVKNNAQELLCVVTASGVSYSCYQKRFSSVWLPVYRCFSVISTQSKTAAKCVISSTTQSLQLSQHPPVDSQNVVMDSQATHCDGMEILSSTVFCQLREYAKI